jgi:1,4-alpha-glucan branching enzyme
MMPLPPDAVAIVEGRHADPFSYLGPHVDNGCAILRVFLPDAQEVSALG